MHPSAKRNSEVFVKKYLSSLKNEKLKILEVKMLSKKHVDKMFIRKELSEEQEKLAAEIEKKAHELAVYILKELRVNNTVEEAILHLKKASMLCRMRIATSDRVDY